MSSTTPHTVGAMSYSLQPQSPLFRLPRELRDRVYHFYVFEPEGLHHHCDDRGGYLRTSTGEPIDVRLMRTCQVVAHELNGLALKINTITFTTADRTSAHPLRSDALRFKRLLDAFDATKWRLLYNNPDCFTPQNTDKLVSQYPQAGRDIILTLRDLREAPEELYQYLYARQQRHDVETREALDMALRLVSTQPGFAEGALNTQRPYAFRQDPDWA
jgi:hypothetical protein